MLNSRLEGCLQQLLTLLLCSTVMAGCTLHPQKPTSTVPTQVTATTPSADDLLASLKARMQHPHTAAPKTNLNTDKQGVSLSQHEPVVPPGPRLLDAINPASGVTGDGNVRYLFISTSGGVTAHHTPVVPPAFNDAYDKTLDQIRAGNYDNSLQKMQNLSMHNPMYSGPLVNEGLIYLKLGKYGSAMKTLQAAVLTNPKNPYAWNALGVALRYEGYFDDARKSYEQALKLDPDYARAHFNLAVLAELYLQDLPLALEHYQRYQALQSTPDAVVGHWIVDLARRTGAHIPVATPTPPAPQASTAP